MATPTLPALVALARAGAVGRAWELFEAAGYRERASDPAALAVKGRLLKGQAWLASGARQPSLFAEAAAAYAAAHALAPAPYLAINAASLRLLAGERSAAEHGAREVLAMLDNADPPADTPYFLAATRAEALLLLGERSAAEAAMAEAARAAPDGWADRAVTVSQLRAIAAAQGDELAWIERFAPPDNLHFAGHMGLAPGGASEAELAAKLSAYLADRRIGFAWGALAAGADIVIAEHLLAHGAALNAVLPCPPDQFEAQSVAPAGAGWTSRYRALLGQLASLRVAAESATSVHDPLATLHAGELAIGGALNNARTLTSGACQLIVTDSDGGGANTARQAALWRGGAGLQHRLTIARDCAVEAMFPPEQPDPARILAWHICALVDLPAEQVGSAALSEITGPISAALSGLPPAAIRSAPGCWELTVEDPVGALDALARLAALQQVSVGAHLAIGPVLAEPASGTLVAYGTGPALARHLAVRAPKGVTLVSDALAVSLAARGPAPLRSELYHPGEADAGGPVHALIG